MVTKVEGDMDELKGLVDMKRERTVLHGRRDNLSKVRGRYQGQYNRIEIMYGGDRY